MPCSFKRGLPDSAIVEKNCMDLKCRLSGLCCQSDIWLFQEAKHLNGVGGQHAASYFVAAWANWLPELRW